MGQDKNARIEREEAQRRAAENDGRRCSRCGAVIPYGTDLDPSRVCVYCIKATEDD